MEQQKMHQINKYKKGKEKNQQKKQKNRENMTLVFKALRPIQEKKDRMQSIVDMLNEGDLSIDTIEKC